MPSLPGAPSWLIISTRTYSPGGRLSVGVSFSQPPLTRVMVVFTRYCSWMILPVTWRFTSPRMRLPPLTSVRTMWKRSKGTMACCGCCGCWGCCGQSGTFRGGRIGVVGGGVHVDVERRNIDVRLHRGVGALEFDDLLEAGHGIDGAAKNVGFGVAVDVAGGLLNFYNLGLALKTVEQEYS